MYRWPFKKTSCLQSCFAITEQALVDTPLSNLHLYLYTIWAAEAGLQL